MPKPREVWFRRTFLWGSTPTHWKGLVVILIGVGVALGGGDAADSLGHPGIGALILLVAVAWVFVVAELHMEGK